MHIFGIENLTTCFQSRRYYQTVIERKSIDPAFGDIEDEHDKATMVERQISDNEYLFSGRLEIEHINEKFNLNMPEMDDYETIAGFILYHHLNLPAANDTIQIEPYTFVIKKLTNTRIDLVQMRVDKI